METFEKLIGQASKIKFPSGVVGKLAKVLVFFIIGLTIIAFRIDNDWISLIIVILIVITVIIISFRIISFADKNPEAALLEGSEFISLEQLRLATKGTGELSVDLKNQVLGKSYNKEFLLQAAELSDDCQEKIDG